MKDSSAKPEMTAESMNNQLDLLADLGRDFATTGDIEKTLYSAVERITNYLNAAGGALFLLNEAGDQLRCHACLGATDITGLELPADKGIVGRCVQSDLGEIVRDVSKDPNFHAAVDEETGFTTKSILCAPMSIKGEKIGAIELINKKGKDGLFSPADLQVLEVLATSAGLAILNARMAEALVEQERVRHELELAAEIQRSLLPPSRDESFPIFGSNYPARTVSGDFYDFFPLDDGRIYFCLGDVSGKGMNAALMMAKASSLFRCLGKTTQSPGLLLERVNAEICETATRGMFVTMAGGIYDPVTGDVILANAGHEPPLWKKADGDFSDFPAESPPLGIIPVITVPEVTFNLAGGSLYIFTDGLTEGYQEDGSELGINGVKSLLTAHGWKPVKQRTASVLDVLLHRRDSLRDDLTILSIEQNAPVADGRLPDDPGVGKRLLYLCFPSRPDRLKLVRAAVKKTMADNRFDDEGARDLIIAIDEACQNVIRHAYRGVPDGEVILELRANSSDVMVTLRDFADPIDITMVKPREIDDIRPGGLGTHFINEIMDKVEFLPSPKEGGNILQMTKNMAL